MKKIAAALVPLTLMLASTADAQLETLQPQVSFSAWRVMTAAGTRMEGPYHYAAGKHRTEMTMQGQTFTAIVREDRELLWTLMPQQSMYMEISFDEGELGNGGAFEGGDVVESRELGTEEVNGYRATKYEVTVRDRSGETASGLLWVTEEMIPVKMDVTLDDRGEHVVVELRDIEIGPQADSLFEVPAGYTRFSLGSLGNLTGAFQGLQQNSPDAPRGDAAESDDPNFAEEVAEGAADGARQGVTEGVRQGVRENVGRRIRGIFNRD